ncbi:gluconokinase [Halomonas sp. HP20-15]|uniref:gluconokinase n=1 Tax=Halomonas sp. HP20-15 TaxID=3085901 RepID=UPI002980B34A|nr:gluconokinase [Halomonas sp. HP20-15]MDW5377350.1 gluconokinase [Halomonas sp. HP20-15]
METTSHCILVMGVSGSGKSHIGRDVAASIGAEFVDADDHHSPTSIAKMSRGEPLNDEDREGWLATLADIFRRYRSENRHVVIGCSALKRHYRDVLRQGAPNLKILYLHGSREVLLQRLNNRGSHFFAGEHMLDSQLSTLEPPTADEAFRVDIRESPKAIVEQFESYLKLA